MKRAGGCWLRTAIDGAWLTARRVRAAVTLLLALQLAGLLFVAAGTHGWIVPLEKATTTDFVSFYAAGRLADAGTPALAYDHAAHFAAEQRIVGAGIKYQYFNYPPVYLLPFAALAALPYLAAFLLFETGTLLLYLLVASRILGDRSPAALIALAAVPIVFWNFGLGQNGFLTAALFGAATLLIDRRPVAAGLLFGALCYKPQFALVVPLALAAAGRWRSFAAAAAAAGGFVLLSLALFGTASWQAWLATAGASPAMYQSGRILFAGMANAFGAARLLGAPPAVAYALQAALCLAAAAVVVGVWRGKLSLSTRAATLAAASLIAAPLALLYDLLLGVVAACWLLRDRTAPAAAGWEKVTLAALYLVLLDGRGLAERWHVPAYPLAALALFAVAANRAWREAALRRAAGDPQRSKTNSGLRAREQQISM
jgi:hypothetical protein